ncbi:hypothetical protein [Gaetbulibacter aestuarii]|uniref:Uncharacterized protein n=1 Tax=Gaetbulibacter aestuarii TaxID=1502358 RepID=A0ABW7MU26_9FLAO
MAFPQNIDGLLTEAEKHELYSKLVQQLNKDFHLANIAIDFPNDIEPDQLKIGLHETVFKLIQEKFADYLNLLYIIDVSEKQVRALEGDDMVALAEAVSFLILKREWQKVWFKARYS